MTEQGVVLSVKKDFAKVRIGRNSACASCGKCGMTDKQKHVDFFADNSFGASVGDMVSLEIPETNSAKLAAVGYLVPLVPALGLLFMSLALKWADWLAAILFVVGLAIGFAVVAVIDKLRRHKWMETPRIVEIVCRASDAKNKDQRQNVEQFDTVDQQNNSDQQINQKGDNNE